ncbi:MAG: hypothetical protein RIR70_1277 [Pseudomonadota bacterium]|jgi:zinc/manganese transport system substrate-binding protein
MRFALLLLVFFASRTLAAEPLPVVASFTILADFTQRVGGERVKVSSLVGANTDAHLYQPTPADARTLKAARLVVINGLGFEGWLERLMKSSGFRGERVVASRGVNTLEAGHSHHGHHHADIDPHAWLDIANAKVYVANIRDALIKADPAGEALYRDNAAKYLGELTALDETIRAQLAALPAARRLVVSSHESLAYFGRAYGVQFRAPLGRSTEAGAAAGDLGSLIRQIRRDKIPAVFLENITDPRLLERVQKETGARLGGTLYSDALSPPSGPAPTYLALMRHNAATLWAALKD